jgi:hypothetical protein
MNGACGTHGEMRYAVKFYQITRREETIQVTMARQENNIKINY